MNRRLLRYNPQFDLFAEPPAASPDRSRRAMRAVDFELDSTDQAAALLDAVGKPELAGYLGRLVRRAARAAGRPVDEVTAAELVALLLPAAHYVLPVPTGAHGASAWVGRFFGVELEGLSPEDREFEAARRFSQLAGEAGRQAALTNPAIASAARARRAVGRAALRYAPGWLSRFSGGPRQRRELQ